MKKTNIKRLEVEKFIEFFKKDNDRSYKEFASIHKIELNHVLVIAKQLQRKNILICIRYNNSDGLFSSKKEILISDLEVIFSLLKI